MAEQLQELLERINQEGIEKAEKKSEEIISAANQKAKKIVQTAEKKAGEVVEAANHDAAKLQESAEKTIDQSFRNIMLSLKEEIQKYLDRILTAQLGEALTPELIGKIILTVTKNCSSQISGGTEVQVLVSPDDAKQLAGGIIERFRKEAGTGLMIKPIPAIDAGFMISFDGGESSYDFTDLGLKDLLSTYISAQLKDIISR
jgi:V/A-type H+-transporting ATPase subunit E